MKVAIVGGGIGAAALARQLEREDVVVFEQGPRPFGQATAQSSGMIRQLGEEPVERTLAVFSAAAMTAQGLLRPTGGVVALRDDPTSANDGVAHLRARGVLVDDPGAVGILTGSPATARHRVPSDGVVDARALGETWLAGSRAAVFTDARVDALWRDGDVVRGVVVAGQRVAADAVVLATGAWGSTLAPSPRRRLRPLRRTVARVKGPEPGGSPWVWFDDRGLWARPEASTWLLSACEEVAEDVPTAVETAGEAQEHSLVRLRAKVDELLPALRGYEVAEAWSGLRTFASDRRPWLGPDPAAPGLFWLAGLGGYGVTCAWACGAVVAARLRGEGVPWLRTHPVDPGRPPLARWPVRPTGEATSAVLLDG